MRIHPLFFCVAWLFASLETKGQEEEPLTEPYRSLPEALRSRAAELPLEPVSEEGANREIFHLNLAEKAFALGNGHQFAAFKIHTPKTPGMDMVWCLQATREWSKWYIVPATGTMKGFAYFLNMDRAYAEFSDTTKPPLLLQSLDASSLQPDSDYFIWFEAMADHPPPGTLSAEIVFATPGNDRQGWDIDSILKLLALHEAAPAAQVAWLHSRGGAILLDPSFFEAAYGEARIAAILKAIRSTETPDGSARTTTTEVTVGNTFPSLTDIAKVHGGPDVVITTAERAYFHPNLSPEEQTEYIAYYDRCGFIYRADDPAHRVLKVEITPCSTAHPRATRDGLTYSDVLLPNLELRIFYNDHKEIGRVANLGWRNAKLLSAGLPLGDYVREDEYLRRYVLTYQGDGRWLYQAYYPDGTLWTKKTAEHHAWQGAMQRFHPNGKRELESTFQNGLMEGELLQWDETGNELPKRFFKNGREIQSD